MNQPEMLDRQALRQILPYGEEFLFVDRVHTLTGDSIEASYQVPLDSPLLRAHFIGFPVMPGVLTGEGLAQAGAVLVRKLLPGQEDKHLLAMKISEASFTGLALPGQTLIYRVKLEKLGSRMAKLQGEAFVGERRIAKAGMTLAVVSKHDLEPRAAE